MSLFHNLLMQHDDDAGYDIIFTVHTTSGVKGQMYTFGLGDEYGNNWWAMIDWGDGFKSSRGYRQSTFTHYYSTQNAYFRVRVKLSGITSANALWFRDAGCSAYEIEKVHCNAGSLWTQHQGDLIRVGEIIMPNCTGMSQAFGQCWRMVSIDKLVIGEGVINLDRAFRDCSSLEHLPEDFLNGRTFSNCHQSFTGCSKLEWHPDPALFWEHGYGDTIVHDDCFKNCTAMDNYGIIPVDWGGPSTPKVRIRYFYDDNQTTFRTAVTPMSWVDSGTSVSNFAWTQPDGYLDIYYDKSGARTFCGTDGSFSFTADANVDVYLDKTTRATVSEVVCSDLVITSAKFKYDVTNLNIGAGDWIDVEMDVTRSTIAKAGLISLGPNIATYQGNDYHYYMTRNSSTSGQIRVRAAATGGVWSREYNTDISSGHVNVRFGWLGMYTNHIWEDPEVYATSNKARYYSVRSIVNALTTAQIGQQEGSNRSSSTYTIKVYRCTDLGPHDVEFTLRTSAANETCTFGSLQASAGNTFVLDWGDGTQTTVDDTGAAISHTYADAGDHVCVIEDSTNVGVLQFGSATAGDALTTRLVSIAKLVLKSAANVYYMVRNCVNLAYVENMYVKVTAISCAYMFGGCTALSRVEGTYDLTDATSVAYMYNECPALTKAPDIIAPAAVSIRYLFAGCTSLVTSPNVQAPVATNAEYMYNECSNLTTLPAGLATCVAITNAGYMFRGCAKLTALPTGFSVPNATTTTNMFSGCAKLVTLPAGFSAASSTVASYMFNQCTSLTSLPAGFTLSSLTGTSAGSVFYNCHELAALPDGFTIGNSTYMYQTFYGCSKLTTLPSSLQLPAGMQRCDQMFRGCSKLVTIPATFWPSQLTYSGTGMTVYYMLYGCTALTSANIPATLFWKSSVYHDWSNKNMGTGASAAVRATIPTQWGGTMTSCGYTCYFNPDNTAQWSIDNGTTWLNQGDWIEYSTPSTISITFRSTSQQWTGVPADTTATLSSGIYTSGTFDIKGCIFYAPFEDASNTIVYPAGKTFNTMQKITAATIDGIPCVSFINTGASANQTSYCLINNVGDILPLGTSARSASVWYRKNSSSYNHSIISYGQAAANKRWTAAVYAANPGKIGVFAYSNTAATTDALVANSVWHHIAWTFEGTTLKIYLDGVLKQTLTHNNVATVDHANNSITIGKQNGTGSIASTRTDACTGYMTHLRLYNYVLTQAEITALAGELTPTT